MKCTGDEESIDKCSHRPWGRHNCLRYNQAGVICRMHRSDVIIESKPSKASGEVWLCVLYPWRILIITPTLDLNRPFPSSLAHLFQSESKCETILMKMTLICMKKKLRVELIFIWKVSHLDSLWNRGTRELGNDLLWNSLPNSINSSANYKVLKMHWVTWTSVAICELILTILNFLSFYLCLVFILTIYIHFFNSCTFLDILW